ncbi:MAG: TonB-dependent receptor [Bryobacteraceae bacterium]
MYVTIIPLFIAASLGVHVSDPQGAAVPGASVTVVARDNSAHLTGATGAQGLAYLNAIPPGDYLVIAAARGFAESAPQSVHVDPDAPAETTIRLAIAAVRSEVVVTADGTPQTVDETSKAVSSIDAAELRDRDVFAMADAVSATAGVRVDQQSGFGGLASISLRGLPAQDTAVLIDGMRFRDPTATQGDASALIQDLIVTDAGGVEILRGAGSSLYGTNAVGGVVNILTDQGGGQNHGSILTEGGGEGTFRGRAEFGGGALGNRLDYSGGVSFLDVTRGLEGDSPARTGSGQGRVSWRVNSNTQIFARLYAADSFAKQKDSPETVANLSPTGIVDAVPFVTFIPSVDDPDYTRAAYFVAAAVGINGHPTEHFGYSVTYQGLATERIFSDGPAGTGYQPEGNVHSYYYGQTHTANAQVNYQWGHQLLDAGYEFERERFASPYVDDLTPANDANVNAAEQSNAFFAQDQVRLFSGRLNIAGSFRAQYFDLNQPVFTPVTASPYASQRYTAPPAAYTGDGSVAYLLRRSGTRIRAHVGRGYRAPSLFERFGSSYDSIYGYSFYGDPRLEPERSISADAGFDQALFRDRLRFGATYFYTQLQEVIAFDTLPVTDPFGRYYGYLNEAGGLSRGVEVSASAAVTRSLDVRGSYTYTSAVNRQPVDGIWPTYLVPTNMFTLLATERVGPRLTVSFSLVASDNYLYPVYDPVTYADVPFRFVGQKLAGLAVNYRIALSDTRAVRLFGNVNNLFDQNYFEGGFRTPPILGLGGLQFEF